MKTSESVAPRACLDYLRLRGHFVIRVNGGAFRTARGGFVRCTDIPGAADILGVTRLGLPLAVECKSETGRLSPGQKLFKAEWENRCGLYVTARSIEDLREAGL